MASRREAIKHGFGALLSLGALHAMPQRLAFGAFARPLDDIIPPAAPRLRPDPIVRLASLGPSETVAGVPFSPQWFGDIYPNGALPFHQCESCDAFPPPSESIDVAIVGGGLSGLSCAYLLRDKDTVLFELRPRLGGSAMGEAFDGQSWSLGSAYFMQADRRTRLQSFYSELGLDRMWRQDNGSFHFSYDGVISDDLLGRDPDPAWRRALALYQDAVQRFALDDYPELPFDKTPSASVVELDGRTFHEDLLLRCGALPPRLEYLLQAYCYSSLGVGFDELNAAAGWNFVAAEEFGRNVLPAGNAGFSDALWNAARANPDGSARVRVRVGTTVASVQPTKDGVLLFTRLPDGTLRTTHARHVICANAKHIVRHMMPWLERADPDKFEAMRQVPTVAYLIANVILKRPVEDDFYDVYLGGGRTFPLDGNAFAEHRVVTDVVNAGFAAASSTRALTFYWPLPWHTARFSIIGNEDWRAYASLLAPQLADTLAQFGLSNADVAQVRCTRWGHAMPYAVPGVYSSGLPAALRRPIHENIWFANQDNWLLPAVETCIAEAMWTADQVREALG